MARKRSRSRLKSKNKKRVCRTRQRGGSEEGGYSPPLVAMEGEGGGISTPVIIGEYPSPATEFETMRYMMESEKSRADQLERELRDCKDQLRRMGQAKMATPRGSQDCESCVAVPIPEPSKVSSDNLVLQCHQVIVERVKDLRDRHGNPVKNHKRMMTLVNQTPHTLRLSPLSTSNTMDGPYTDIPSHTDTQIESMSLWGCSVPTEINGSCTGQVYWNTPGEFTEVTITYTDVKVNKDWYFVKTAMYVDAFSKSTIKLKGSLQDFMDLTQGGQPLSNETMRLDLGDRLKYITGDPITNTITGEIIPPIERPPYQGFCKTDWGGYMIPYESIAHHQYPHIHGNPHGNGLNSQRLLSLGKDGGIMDSDMWLQRVYTRGIPPLSAHGIVSQQCIDMNLDPSKWHIINTTTHTFDIYSVTASPSPQYPGGLHPGNKLFSIGPSETESEDWEIFSEVNVSFTPAQRDCQRKVDEARLNYEILIRNVTDPPLRGGRLDRVPPYLLRGAVSRSTSVWEGGGRNAMIIVDPAKDMNQTAYIAPGTVTMEEIQEKSISKGKRGGPATAKELSQGQAKAQSDGRYVNIQNPPPQPLNLQKM